MLITSISCICSSQVPVNENEKLNFFFWTFQMEERRRQVQEDHEREYQKALVEIKDDIREKDGDEMIETMKDEIRDWFQNDK